MTDDYEDIYKNSKYHNVVTLSGGIDSTVVAWLLKAEWSRTIFVHVDVGIKKHVKAAQDMAKLAGVELEIVPMADVIQTVKKPNTFFIPGFKALIWISTLAVANKHDAWNIYTGDLYLYSSPEDNIWDRLGESKINMANFHEFEPVASQELFSWYGRTYHGDHYGYNYIAPLFGKTKQGVIELGKQIGAPLNLTVTCRDDSVPGNCGKCNFCKTMIKYNI